MGDKTDLGYTLDYFNAQERSTAEVQEALQVAIKALAKILKCKQADPVKYVRECDSIALEALVTIECSVP